MPDAAAKTLETIVTTPLDILFILIGLLMVSVGFGLKFEAAIDVARVNPVFARIAGISLLVLGLMPNLSKFAPKFDLRDPFIWYYIVCVAIFVIVCFLMMKYTHGQKQLLLLKSTFAFIGTLLTITVLWRAMDVYFYAKDPNTHNVPLGFDQHANFFPYFVLFGAGVLLIAWIVFYYTDKDSNSANRLPIFGYLAVFSIYLIFCRLGWETVDYVGTRMVSASLP